MKIFYSMKESVVDCSIDMPWIDHIVEIHCYVPNIVPNAYNVLVIMEPPNAVVSPAGGYTILVVLITDAPHLLQQ
jgi:hypothetical protein